jgi:hypothetical protein
MFFDFLFNLAFFKTLCLCNFSTRAAAFGRLIYLTRISNEAQNFNSAVVNASTAAMDVGG